MKRCDLCGNEYEQPIQITIKGKTYTFDSFECAIHLLAPACQHCGCKIIGHGIQAGNNYYCCAHCARASGIQGAQDHVNHTIPAQGVPQF